MADVVEVSVRHPAAVVTALFVGFDHVEEDEIRLGELDIINGAVGQDSVGVFKRIGLNEFRSHKRADAVNVAERFPAVVHRTAFAHPAEKFKQPGHGMHGLDVVVGHGAVAFRRYAVEHGEMAGKRDRRKNRACVEGIGSLRGQFVEVGIAAGAEPVRTHPVNGDENDFVLHGIPPEMNRIGCHQYSKFTGKNQGVPRKRMKNNVSLESEDGLTIGW